MSAVDYTVYLVTDAPEQYADGLFGNVEGALAGGVTIVQYRATSGSRRQQFETALALRKLLREFGVPLIINDAVDLALAVEADGVHVGQADMPVDVVRRLIGRERLLGLSITAPEQVAAVSGSVDYLGVGPVFATPSKPDAAPALGLAELARVRAMTRLPIVAIGGITVENVGSVFAAGADGVAVVSAFSRASDPAAVARAFRRAKDGTRNV